MRIIGQCYENEAREIFEAQCDKSDIWVVKSEGSCPGMVSYTVFGLIIGESNNRLFAVEERFVDGKGSKDCANRVCLHAVRKYLAQYGCKLGKPIGEFMEYVGGYEIERMWGRGHSDPVMIAGRPYGNGDAYYA